MPCFLKFYIWFGVLLELAINFYFVKFHEVAAFEPIQHIKNLKNIKINEKASLITNQKFEANYYSLLH